MKPGPPLPEAKKEASQLGQQIQERAIRLRPLVHSSAETVHHLYYPAGKKEGELTLTADYYLWLPPDVKKIRGVIVHQHGCGDGASKGGVTAAFDLHWRELASKWDCALLGTSYEGRAGVDCRAWCDPRRGSAKRFEQGLTDFAKQTGHAELATVPWCLWGHSGGGFWASIMQALYPERIVAIWLQSGQAYSRWSTDEIPSLDVPEEAYRIPVVACPGYGEKSHERFQVAWKGCLAMFAAYRKHDAPFIFAPDPKTGHECGESRYLAIPFFDACLKLRLPEQGSESQTLQAIDMEQGLNIDIKQALAATDTIQIEQEIPTVWLPNADLAAKWKEFIKTGTVKDTTPPSTPKILSINKSDETVTIHFNLTADFESGLSFIELSKNGQVIAVLPEKKNSRFGAPLLQGLSYHDTPEQPLPELKFVVTKEQWQAGDLAVTSVNSAGLRSAVLGIENQ